MYLKKLSYSPDSFKILLSEREFRAMFWALDSFSARTCPDMAIVVGDMVSKIIDSKLLNFNVVNYAVTD